MWVSGARMMMREMKMDTARLAKLTETDAALLEEMLTKASAHPSVNARIKLLYRAHLVDAPDGYREIRACAAWIEQQRTLNVLFLDADDIDCPACERAQRTPEWLGLNHLKAGLLGHRLNEDRLTIAVQVGPVSIGPDDEAKVFSSLHVTDASNSSIAIHADHVGSMIETLLALRALRYGDHDMPTGQHER